MAHEIDYTGNIVRFGQSIDNRPAWWERQGEFEGGRLDPNLPAHVWRETVLPWSVRHVPVQFTTIGTPEKPSTTVVCDDRFVNYRDDTNAHLTTNASGSYHLHSIGRIVDALDMVCKEAGFQPNTMGSLRGGKEIFMMAKTQGKELIAGERFRRYIVMGTSYDQTRLSFTYQTDMAVVCQNTLTASMKGAASVFLLSHRYEYDPKKVIGDLGLFEEQQKAFEDQVETLASKAISKDDMNEFFYRVIMKASPDDDISADFKALGKTEEGKVKQADIRDTVALIADSYSKAPGGVTAVDSVPSRVGTLHGATQAVYHYVDHKMLTLKNPRKLKDGSFTSSKSTRFSRSFFGDGAKLKQRAHELGLSIAA